MKERNKINLAISAFLLTFAMGCGTTTADTESTEDVGTITTSETDTIADEIKNDFIETTENSSSKVIHGEEIFLVEEETRFSKTICEMQGFESTNIWGTYVFDFDGDRSDDGIVLTGYDFDYDVSLWYVSGNGCVSEFPIDWEIEYPECIYSYSLTINNETFFVCNLSYCDDETAGLIYGVRNEQLYQVAIDDCTFLDPKIVNKYNELACIEIKYNGAGEVTSDTYVIDEEYGLGYSWIPYPFYYDEQLEKFIEYGAKEISGMDEVAPANQYEYQFMLEELTDGATDKKYIYRENNEIDIVCSYDEDYGYSFKTVVLRIDSENKKVIYDYTYIGKMSISLSKND